MSRLAEEIRVLAAEAQAILEDPESKAEDLERVDRVLQRVEELKARDARVAEVKAAMGGVLEKAKEEQQKQEPAGGFKDWSEFLKSVWRSHPRHARSYVDPRLKWFEEERATGEEKQMSGVDVASGGALIPPEFRAQLYAAVAETSLVRARATIIPMASRIADIPAVDQGEIIAGQPSWFGGLSFQWVGEGLEKPETEPRFRTVSLRAKKLVGYTISSDELVADSAISIGGFLAGPMGFSGGVRFMEDHAFLNGTGGAAMPLGILNATTVSLTVLRSVTSEINYVDLLNMMTRALDLGTAVWIANRMTISTLMQMDGPAGNPSYLWGSANAGVPTSLLGLPILWTEKLPRLGARGDIILASLPYYVIGDRQATTVETTQFDRWRFDQTSWRVVHRVDGQPWLNRPIPLIGAVGPADTVSPFVVLGLTT